jgi:site-specific DNA-methyltransferase (adenine-specific)
LPLRDGVVPFIITKKAKLYLGDAIDTLNSFHAESVDMIFADPPYNLSNGGTTCHAGKRVSVNKAFWDTSRGIKEDFSMRGFSALTGKMGKYVQPRTKGAGHGSISRAFYARPDFLKQFVIL